MQVEKVSGTFCIKPTGNQHLCTNRINSTSKFASDSATFGHGIILPDTQSALTNLIQKLAKAGNKLKIKDVTIGEISAATKEKHANIVWDLVVSVSSGKGADKTKRTYFYSNADGKIAREERFGASSHFTEESKLSELDKLEWNNSIQQLAIALFRHLPQ